MDIFCKFPLELLCTNLPVFIWQPCLRLWPIFSASPSSVCKLHVVNYQYGISMGDGAAAPFGGQVLSKVQDFLPGLGRNTAWEKKTRTKKPRKNTQKTNKKTPNTNSSKDLKPRMPWRRKLFLIFT